MVFFIAIIIESGIMVGSENERSLDQEGQMIEAVPGKGRQRDNWDSFMPVNEDRIIQGEIIGIYQFLVYVDIDEKYVGIVNAKEIPGCKAPFPVSAIGDKMKVRVVARNKFGKAELKCVRFPVRD